MAQAQAPSLSSRSQGGTEMADELRQRSIEAIARSLSGGSAARESKDCLRRKRAQCCMGSSHKRNRLSNSVVDEATPLSTQCSVDIECQELKRLTSRFVVSAAQGDMNEVMDVLNQLQGWPMTLQMLRLSGVGRAVNQHSFGKSGHSEAAARSRLLVDQWRRMCRQDRDAYRGKREELRLGAKCLEPSRAAACAEELEEAIWRAAQEHAAPGARAEPRDARRGYLCRARSLVSALRRPEGAELRRQILDGALSPQDLLRMAPEEFLPQGRRALRERERREALRAAVVAGSMFTCFSERLECPRCGAKGARYATPGSEE